MDWTPTDIIDRPDTTVASCTTFTDTQGASPSIAIATTLASLEDTSPCRTDFRLADEVDSDALNDLVTDDDHDVMVAFTIEDYIVVVQSNGRMQILATEE